jgi:4-hydroxy-3-methylbut-2-en-1-yl diphosphate synthase IspG/GcpE
MAFRRAGKKPSDPAQNPDRTGDLFKLTGDGYIIAQDISSQYEYVQAQACPGCGCPLQVIAQINRSFQGLNELVAACPNCGKNASFIFDISNEVYQTWWAERMGDMYVQNYDGPPRTARRR